MHDARIGTQHGEYGRSLKEIEEDRMVFHPCYNGRKMFCCKGAEEKDENIMKDKIIQSVDKEIVPQRGRRGNPNIRRIIVENDISYE
jgi:hypothetical protein